MLLTITNLSSTAPVYVSMCCKSLAASEVITVSRTVADIDRDLQLKQLVSDGLVSVTQVRETLDTIQVGSETPQAFSNATRPAANTRPKGCMIWNTDDGAPNFSDGTTNWLDAAGNIT